MTFHQSAFDAADLTTYTFASQPIGTASATRRVIVSISTNSTRTISSVTIGGVSATIDATNTLSGTGHVAIASAVVPTGTTASVVVTLDSAGLGMGIGVWTLVGASPTGMVATGNGDPTNLTVTTTAGDVVIAYAFTSGVGTALFAWSVASERFEEDVYSTTTTHSGADATAVGSSTAVSVDPSASTTVGVAAAYAAAPVGHSISGTVASVSSVSGVIARRTSAAGSVVSQSAAVGAFSLVGLMASTVTPHEDMDPSPRVDVFIDDADLDPDTVTITVHQLSAAGDFEVRNMRGVSAVGGFAGTDYAVPLGVPITYKVQQYDVGGAELGFVLSLVTQVDIDPRFAVFSDPLAPGDAVLVRMERDFANTLTRRRPTQIYRAGYQTRALMGLQTLLEDVRLRCWTDTAEDRDVFWEVVSRSSILVRIMPNSPLPLLFHAVIPDVNQVPFDYHAGGTTDVWDITGQQISRPEIDILVAVINYGRFADYMNTLVDNSYGNAATIWSTYIDAMLNPPPAV
jgi:hypothetical protein